MKILVLLMVSATITSSSLKAKIIEVSINDINKYEKLLLSELTSKNASNSDILKRYYYVAQEFAENEKYEMAYEIMDRGLKGYLEKNQISYLKNRFLCEMALRSKQFEKAISCVNSTLSGAHNRRLMLRDPSLYLDFKLMLVKASKIPYETVLNRVDINLIKDRSLDEYFLMADLQLYLEDKNFKKSLDIFNKFPRILEDYSYSTIYDYILWKTNSSLPKQCFAYYKVFADTFKRKLPYKNATFQICAEVSQKYPDEAKIKASIKKFGESDSSIIKNFFKDLY